MRFSKVNNGISYMELHIPTFHMLHWHCTFNTHISNFEILIVGTVGTVSSKRLFVPFHLCPSNIKGLHLVHCVHGSDFVTSVAWHLSIIAYPSLCYLWLSIVKKANLLLLPIYITCDFNVFVLFEAIMLYFANVIICKDILLHIKLLLNFIMTTHMVSLCKVSKVKLRLLYCHPPQLRPATPGLWDSLNCLQSLPNL